MNQGGKTIAQMRAENPNFDRDLEVSFHLAAQATPSTLSIAQLVEQHQQLRAYIDGEQQRLSDFLKPWNEKLEATKQQCMEAMQQQGVKSLKTDHGTAIISEHSTAKIKPEERDAFIDYCMDNWDDFGNEALQIGAPKADAVRAYMETHDGHLPPHVEISSILRFSVRKA